MLKKLSFTLFLVILALALFSCGQHKEEQYEPSEIMKQPDSVAITKASAILEPTKGYEAKGTVTFTKVDGGIKIVADVEGLTPGKHGFHIHEKGDCTAPDGSSAGGHFNPDGVKHGGPKDAVRHVGDMGNLIAGKDGKAHYEWVDPLMSFSGPHNIIGRGVIVHGGEDDLVSQPSGNAGPRVACGVIEIQE
jgi:superoxide dismutase, Cu-Zn family